MPRLLLTALIAALLVAVVALAVREAKAGAAALRRRVPVPSELGETPMQRLSFVLLVALIFYAAIWGAG